MAFTGRDTFLLTEVQRAEKLKLQTPCDFPRSLESVRKASFVSFLDGSHVSHSGPQTLWPLLGAALGEHLSIKDNQQTRCESPRWLSFSFTSLFSIHLSISSHLFKAWRGKCFACQAFELLVTPSGDRD